MVIQKGELENLIVISYLEINSLNYENSLKN